MSQNQPKPNFFASMQKASQRFAAQVADTGAKTMLKTDVVFLERDIKARKQTFGIEAYDILSSNPDAVAVSTQIQAAFEACKNDIAQLEGKVDSKRREMDAIEGGGGGGGAGGSGGSGGRMDDAEAPGIPSTP